MFIGASLTALALAFSTNGGYNIISEGDSNPSYALTEHSDDYGDYIKITLEQNYVNDYFSLPSSIDFYFGFNNATYNFGTLYYIYNSDYDVTEIKFEQNNFGDNHVNFYVNYVVHTYGVNADNQFTQFTYLANNRDESELFYIFDYSSPYDVTSYVVDLYVFPYSETIYNYVTSVDGESYGDGYNYGYQIGEDKGYQDGLVDGKNDYIDSQDYQDALDSSYASGHNAGYYEGLNTQTYTFGQLFGAIADTPIMIMYNLLGFDVFGVSALSIVMTMLTGCMVLFLIKRIIL